MELRWESPEQWLFENYTIVVIINTSEIRNKHERWTHFILCEIVKNDPNTKKHT